MTGMVSQELTRPGMRGSAGVAVTTRRVAGCGLRVEVRLREIMHPQGHTVGPW